MSLRDLDEMRSFRDEEKQVEALIDTSIALGLEAVLVDTRAYLVRLRAEHGRDVDNFHISVVGTYSI